jgi:hypothetical protein
MQKREALFIGLSGCVLIGFYHLIFGQFYPNVYGKLGHDYALFLPKLLDGYFWYRTNGLFAVPWFTPAFCGGTPLFPDPQSIYYSVPQFLSFVTDPLTSVYLTVLLFAALGFLGFYLLLRRGFLTTSWTALLGAGLFLFNGFYAHRMIVGHLTYHPFMLISFLAFFLLRTPSQHQKDRWWHLTYDTVLAGILMAYMFHAGMVNVVLPALASVVVIGLLQSLIQQQSSMFWRRLIFGGCVALALCSAKLLAAMAYLHYFGRDIYRLPGLGSLFGATVLTVRALFMGGEAAYELFPKAFVNLQWQLELHEFEFGMTFVPLLLLLVGGIACVCRARAQEAQAQLRWQDWLRIGTLVALLLLPICLNYYTPQWNAFLKHLPIFKSSSLMIRWVSLYIPVIVLLAAVGLDRMVSLRPYQPAVVLLSLTTVVLLNSSADRTYYHAQPYEPSQIIQAYHRAHHHHWTPTISHIAVFTDHDGRWLTPPARNDVIAQGYSQLLCYEPLFGYRLETFPYGTLTPGAVMTMHDGFLNLKNPSCYVYPTANGCAPGDHFMIRQRPAAEAFITYRPFPFSLPAWQKAADLLNLVAVMGVLGFLIAAGVMRCFQERMPKPLIAK